MERSRFLIAGSWLALCLAGAAPGAGQCPVVDGDFAWVWGDMIQNVFVVDATPTLAWTVEGGGRIRNTQNGVDWAFQVSPPCTQGQLRAIQVLRPAPQRTGWAVGGDGAVIKTTDGGATWNPVATILDAGGKPAILWDVYFKDAQNGWVAGEHVFKRSTDGGASWTDVTVVHPNDPAFTLAAGEYYALDFAAVSGSYVGLAAAEPGLILRTDQSTAGATWTVVFDPCSTLPLAPPLCSACATACGSPGDRFEPWDLEFVPGTTSLAQAKAIVVGGFGAQCGQFLASADGGLTWKQEFPLDDPCNSPTAAATCACAAAAPSCPGSGGVAVVPTQYNGTAFGDASALSVGYGGTIFVRDTTCTPPVWRLQPQVQGPHGPFTQPLRGVDGNGVNGGAGTGIAWATGSWGGLYKTTDGGGTWAVQTPTIDIVRMGDVHFASDAEGWAVAQSFRVLKSADGGASWSDQDVVQGAGSLRDLAFAAGHLAGVAVGSYYTGDPKILRTTTGGTGAVATGGGWKDATSLPALAFAEKSLSAVTWTAGNEFWAVGANGIVLDSTDGGATWSRVRVIVGGVTMTTTLNGVAFTDPDTGYVVGRDGAAGRIYRVTHATTPATRVWTDVSPAGATDLQGIAARGTLVYAVGKKSAGSGEAGAVYRFTGSAFQEEVLPSLPPCDFASDLTDSPPFFALKGLLNEVAIAPTTPQVFVGGSCGRFLHYDGAAWQELKSETSSHINGMSFYADDRGYVHAASPEVIVKYTP